MSLATCHCPDQGCNAPIQIEFCGAEPAACECVGLLFCLHCGEPLDYEILHDEAQYWASLRAGV